MTRILGIDPGSRRTGLGLIESADGDVARCVAHATVCSTGGEFPQRLGVIFSGVAAFIADHRPDAVAVEAVFVSRNVQSALKLGQARGAAISAAVAAGLPVAEYSPNAIKKALVGGGHAGKGQVQHMVGILLGTAERIDEDPADALAAALCHLHHSATAERLARFGA